MDLDDPYHGKKKTSVGVVLDAETFKAMKLKPEDAYTQILKENPEVIGQMSRARRVTQVHAAGDFSFRNRRFTGDRWVLAGDAAGFIDPFYNRGVFMAFLWRGCRHARRTHVNQRRAPEFARYGTVGTSGHV
jgi:flavin-dependent dehydrogenase